MIDRGMEIIIEGCEAYGDSNRICGLTLRLQSGHVYTE